MKKLYFLVFAIISFIGISSVNADTLTLSDYSDSYDQDVSFILSHQSEIDIVTEVWEQYFSSQYSYYFIRYSDTANSIMVSLSFSDSPYLSYDSVHGTFNFNYSSNSPQDNMIVYYSRGRDGVNPSLCYKNHWSTVDDNCTGGFPSAAAYYLYTSTPSVMYTYKLPIINHGFKYSENSSNYDILSFDGFVSTTYNQTISSFDVTYNELLPDISGLYDGTYSPDNTDNYIEINLNDYNYVLLSLKSYRTIDTQYSTIIYTKGSLCITPVYNYGMKEKKDYYSGYQVQGCSEYYSDFTRVNFYILPQDVDNHAVYYVKSSNTYVDNFIKVDSDIFDITYITDNNSSNPTVVIDGRSYPVIPYNDLTDTAIISSEEGYISGQTCALGDVNCYYSNTGININDLFSHPLILLESVWLAITNVFSVIAAFIGFLPPTLQGFMFTAFMLAVVLGIIKIIIG